MSNYEIRKNDQGKMAIFNSLTNEQVSRWWYGIGLYGLVNEESFYYIGTREDNKKALFKYGDSEKPVSGWWPKICPNSIIIDYR